jgi:hypothetical protein
VDSETLAERERVEVVARTEPRFWVYPIGGHYNEAGSDGSSHSCDCTWRSGSVLVWRNQADWNEVEVASIRVNSGLKHETLIALKSKFADLDAALTRYVANGRDRQAESKVISIQQAIASLEWAIDNERPAGIWDGDDGFSYYERNKFLVVDPHCAESKGRLFVNGADLERASLSYAQSHFRAT